MWKEISEIANVVNKFMTFNFSRLYCVDFSLQIYTCRIDGSSTKFSIFELVILTFFLKIEKIPQAESFLIFIKNFYGWLFLFIK